MISGFGYGYPPVRGQPNSQRCGGGCGEAIKCWATREKTAGGAKTAAFASQRQGIGVIFVLRKVFGHDGAGRFIHLIIQTDGGVARFFVTEDWGPAGAVWIPEIDDLRSDVIFGGRRSGTKTLYLHLFFAVILNAGRRSGLRFGPTMTTRPSGAYVCRTGRLGWTRTSGQFKIGA